jgi:hypothetical protein
MSESMSGALHSPQVAFSINRFPGPGKPGKLPEIPFGLLVAGFYSRR